MTIRSLYLTVLPLLFAGCALLEQNCYGPYGGTLAFTGAVGGLATVFGIIFVLAAATSNRPDKDKKIGQFLIVTLVGLLFIVFTFIVNEFNWRAC